MEPHSPDADPAARRIHELRQEYGDRPLEPADLAHDPIVQFSSWFDAARAAEILEPNAMTIATVDAAGHPDARIVLLKELRPDGFVFFTSYASAKGAQLAASGLAALVFFWDRLERQVRVSGTVERIPAGESDAYFRSRPLKSRIAAAASPQSQRVASRGELEVMLARTAERFADDAVVPRPATWGGYLVRPASVEFWQGRRSRLHDRLRYVRDGESWRIERLAP